MDENRVYMLLDKIEAKLDRIEERLNNVDIHLAKYNSELEFHIARTNQLEDALKPVLKHVDQVRGAAKLVGIITAIITFVVGIWSSIRK